MPIEFHISTIHIRLHIGGGRGGAQAYQLIPNFNYDSGGESDSSSIN